jgi:hypothetical protein
MLRRWFVRATVAATIAVAFVIILSIWIEITTVHAGSAPSPAQSAVDGLPADATDIHWRLPHVLEPNTVYDFSITREGFEKWVDSKRFDALVGPISGPAIIVTYDPLADMSDQREFEHAILYRWYEEDRGIDMLYDTMGNRAYYFSHTR